jgi:formate dehydrogenase alpha subunit
LSMDWRYQETIKAISQGRIKAAYIMGSNLARAMPEISEPLSNLEFLVVQDLFLTETAKLASVVFPAASFAEIDGTFASPRGEKLLVKKAIEPLGSSKPDWQITAMLAKKMFAAGFEYDVPEAIHKEMPPWREKIQEDGKYLHSIAPETSSHDHPFILMTGPSLFSFGSSTRASRIPDLRYLTKDRYVEINHVDAQNMGISQGDQIILESGKGSIKALAKISRRVAGGVLRIELQPELTKIMDGRTCAVRVKPDV